MRRRSLGRPQASTTLAKDAELGTCALRRPDIGFGLQSLADECLLVRDDGLVALESLHAAGVEGRAPAAFVVAGELQVESLVRHADGSPPDACPRVEVRAESVEPSMIGRAMKSGKADGCSQELAALVEHVIR